MQQYPDLLNNPDNDPRITQHQYEGWYREQKEREEEYDRKNEYPHDPTLRRSLGLARNSRRSEQGTPARVRPEVYCELLKPEGGGRLNF